MGSWRERAGSRRLYRRQESLLPSPCIMPRGVHDHSLVEHILRTDDMIRDLGTHTGYFALDRPHEGPSGGPRESQRQGSKLGQHTLGRYGRVGKE